jgi:hypothetical protein
MKHKPAHFVHFFNCLEHCIFRILSYAKFSVHIGVFFCSSVQAQIQFIRDYESFPRQEKNLRKWDAPVSADLDRDGYQDLLINDHGYGVQVQWNNNGVFSKPYDIIMGDIHGVAIGDFDSDDTIELVMSRGGGSGSNARNAVIFRVSKQREFTILPDFKTPLAYMRGRTVAFTDGDNDGDLDLLNFAFPDASKKGASENYIYENDGNGQLILNGMLDASQRNGQKIHIVDFNGDNASDLIVYGNRHAKVFQGNGDLTYTEITAKVFPYPIEHITSISQLDFDNDGDLDLYITRGKEFKKGQSFYNSKTQKLGFYTTRGAFQLDDLDVGEVLTLENFQSQWPNNDTYYIGEASYKYTFSGETHSGKDIQLVNSNALGFPTHPNFKDITGWYIGYVGNQKWRIAGYLWAPSTGVVHNVKNYQSETYPHGPSDILLENRNGIFKDVTKKKNIFHQGHTMASEVADVNNDGYKDIIAVPRGKMVFENELLLFINRAGKSFQKAANHGLTTNDLGAIGMAVGVIDYNNDGKVDVVLGNERGKWHLFKNNFNTSNNHNFLTIHVGKAPKKKTTALGAVVKLKSCSGVQTHVVGSSPSQYSQGLNNVVHFGLGNCTLPVTIEVIWSNGEKIKKTTKTINSILHIGK